MKNLLLRGASLLFTFVLIPAHAELLPSFMHESLAANSDHIVLVTEGESIDGKLTVLAAYKGNLAAGSEIKIPELAVFSDRDKRKVQSFLSEAEPRHAEVSCDLMILFLDGEASSELRPSFAPEWFTWLCWIEDGLVYARWQPINPGNTILLPYGGVTGDSLQTILKEISRQESPAKKASVSPG